MSICIYDPLPLFPKSTTPHITYLSIYLHAHGALGRGVLRRLGGSRSTRKSQQRHLRRLYVTKRHGYTHCLRSHQLTTFFRFAAVDTKLADRTACSTPTTAPPSGAQSPAAAARSPSTTDPKKQSKGEPAQSPHDLLALTRADLSEAQRSRSELQDRLSRTKADLEKLRKRSTLDGRRIKTLEQDATHLQLRLKDRDEELRGKAKLLDVGLVPAHLFHFPVADWVVSRISKTNLRR